MFSKEMFKPSEVSEDGIDILKEKELLNLDQESLLKLMKKYKHYLSSVQSCEAEFGNRDKVVNAAKSILRILQIMKSNVKLDQDRTAGFKNKVLKRKLYRKLGGCAACGGGTMGTPSRHDAPIELHHIVPRLYGGNDDPSNALLVCRDCHGLIHG